MLHNFLADDLIWHAQAIQSHLVPFSTKAYHPIPCTPISRNPRNSWSQLVTSSERLERQYGWSIKGEAVALTSASTGTSSAPALTRTAPNTHTFQPGDQTLAVVPDHDAVLVWRKDRRHRRAAMLDLRTCELLWSYCPARWAGPSSGVHSTFGAVQQDDWLVIGWNWVDFPMQRDKKWLSIHRSSSAATGDDTGRARFAWTMDVELPASKQVPQMQLHLPNLFILDSERQVLSRVHLPSGSQTQMLVPDLMHPANPAASAPLPNAEVSIL